MTEVKSIKSNNIFNICDKCKEHSINLNNHIEYVHKQVHYVCTKCNKSSQNYNLSNHYSNVHEEDSSESFCESETINFQSQVKNSDQFQYVSNQELNNILIDHMNISYDVDIFDLSMKESNDVTFVKEDNEIKQVDKLILSEANSSTFQVVDPSVFIKKIVTKKGNHKIIKYCSIINFRKPSSSIPFLKVVKKN